MKNIIQQIVEIITGDFEKILLFWLNEGETYQNSFW